MSHYNYPSDYEKKEHPTPSIDSFWKEQAEKAAATRATKEQELAKTAKAGIELYKNQVRKAEENLIIHFVVGGMDIMRVGALSLKKAFPINMFALYYDNELIALRSALNPLAPVFILRKGAEAPLRGYITDIENQLRLLMKGYIYLDKQVMNSEFNGL